MLSVTGSSARVDSSSHFEEYFKSFYPELFGLTYRLLGDRGQTEDILQEAFLRLSHSDVLTQSEGAVGAWLRRVCLNLSTNWQRDRRRATDRLARNYELERGGAGTDNGPSGAVLRLEEQAEVREYLVQLPARQRDCLLLRHAGYSYTEIAETLGVSIGSVGVILSRGEKAFKALYLEEHPKP